MPSTLSELRSRRHLLWVLTTSNIKRTNKHSTLGRLWWLLDPILLGTVYYVLASMLFERRANQPFALLRFGEPRVTPWVGSTLVARIEDWLRGACSQGSVDLAKEEARPAIPPAPVSRELRPGLGHCAPSQAGNPLVQPSMGESTPVLPTWSRLDAIALVLRIHRHHALDHDVAATDTCNLLE